MKTHLTNAQINKALAVNETADAWSLCQRAHNVYGILQMSNSARREFAKDQGIGISRCKQIFDKLTDRELTKQLQTVEPGITVRFAAVSGLYAIDALDLVKIGYANRKVWNFLTHFSNLGNHIELGVFEGDTLLFARTITADTGDIIQSTTPDYTDKKYKRISRKLSRLCKAPARAWYDREVTPVLNTLAAHGISHTSAEWDRPPDYFPRQLRMLNIATLRPNDWIDLGTPTEAQAWLNVTRPHLSNLDHIVNLAQLKNG